ncbi:STAS domain-containing protein [Umezawaea sp.]|uniref:STAS domain-containing protein n=1 Tax=Umezawaea sp. TaxID=1955258 RepID=UPI002ED2670C
MDDVVSAGFAQISRRRGATVLTVAAEVDMATSGVLRWVLYELLGERPATLVLDLHRVGFFGSSGTNALIGAVHRAERLGVRFVVAADKRAVLRVLAVTGAADLVAVYGCVPEALEAFVPRPRAGAGLRVPSGVR